MATTTLQSNLMPIKVSSDSGTTYKSIVCKKGWTFNGSTSTTKEETDCGVLLGIGANEWSFDVEGVVNTTPSGSTEVSAEDLLNLWVNQTALKIKTDYPVGSGTDLYFQGDCYMTSYKVTNAVGNLINFSATFSGTGTLDNTP